MKARFKEFKRKMPFIMRTLRPRPPFKGTDREAKIVGHGQIYNWLGTVATSKEVRVLEIGSRAVVSNAIWKTVAPNCDYVGFDYHEGKNVDVVGDAHRLSEYFEDESFDVVISSAVFEHLAMPWVIAEEISKVLKVGGYAATETTFAFSEHEMPWNFFQFHYQGLKCLFNPALGFDVLDAGFSNPLVAWFSNESSPYLRGKRVSNIYCHSNLLVQKNRTVLNSESPPFDWKSAATDFQMTSSYPEGTGYFKDD